MASLAEFPEVLNSSPLSEELKTYEAHKPALLLSSAGKYALIKGQDVIGVFDRKQEAFTEGYRRFQLNAFMVQRIQEELDTCVIGGSEMELLS